MDRSSEGPLRSLGVGDRRDDSALFLLSGRYVHQECLVQWLSHRNAKHCELCKTPFRFTPVYLPNAPARLPVIEIARGISKVAVEYVQLGLRVLLVLALWGFVVPHATSCSWRLFFISSVHELLSLPQKELELDRIFSDWVVGVILSSFVVVTFLGFTSLREYLIQLDDGGNMDLLMEAVEADAPVADAAPVPLPILPGVQDQEAEAEVEADAEPDAAVRAQVGLGVRNARPDVEAHLHGDNHDEEVPLAVLIGLKVCTAVFVSRLYHCACTTQPARI